MTRSIFALALFLVLGLVGCQGEQEIISSLTETEANEILVVLQSQKIDALKVEKPGRVITYSVSVRGSQSNDALKLLVENKLPRPKSDGLAEVYPPGGQGLIPTRSEEKARYLMALQGQVENMIKILPGVIQAKVAIVLPDTETIRDIKAAPPKASASVAIIYNPTSEDAGPAFKADDIKYLVASSIEDLSPSGVTVILSKNVPAKLVGAKLFNGLPIVRKSEDSKQSAKELEYQHELERNRLLIWVFGVVAVLGLMLGLLGIVRALSLRSKLLGLQAAMPEPLLAGVPPEVAKPAEPNKP